MAHLPAPEHDRDLDLVTFAQKAGTCRVLVSKSPGPILGRYFISLIPVLVVLRRDSLARWAASYLKRLVVHDLADGRVGFGGHLDEVQVHLTSDGEGLRQGFDSKLVALRVDEANLPGPDPIIGAVLVLVRCSGYAASLLR